MKKLSAFLCSLIIVFIVINTFGTYFDQQISQYYFGRIGDSVASEKTKNIALQKEAIRREDSLFLLGSSEFENYTNVTTHPSDFFKNKRSGFQVYLEAKAGRKSLVQAINIGALDQYYENQKVVFFVSPQWFIPDGIDQDTFLANSSEAQIMSFMLNGHLSADIKKRVAKRLLEISKNNANPDFAAVWDFCRLYTREDTLGKLFSTLMIPYYKINEYSLRTKDSFSAYKYLRASKAIPYGNPPSATINWAEERNKAVQNAEKTSHNIFKTEDDFYNRVTKAKGGLDKMKNLFSGENYEKSIEYEDFKIFLDICRELKVNLMVVSVPVHGSYYDYCGFKQEYRQSYYQKIRDIVASSGYPLADFTNHEYDDYFLRDYSHLGWKGWVYVDETLANFYQQGKK